MVLNNLCVYMLGPDFLHFYLIKVINNNCDLFLTRGDEKRHNPCSYVVKNVFYICEN